jgi:hypothetical protein
MELRMDASGNRIAEDANGRVFILIPGRENMVLGPNSTITNAPLTTVVGPGGAHVGFVGQYDGIFAAVDSCEMEIWKADPASFVFWMEFRTALQEIVTRWVRFQ